MNVMYMIKTIQFLINLAILCVVLYYVFVALPEYRELFISCEAKQLCINGDLKGTVCDPYLKDDYFVIIR